MRKKDQQDIFSWLQLFLPVHVSFLAFTALRVMHTRYCDENSVRPSVRLSVRLSVCPSVTRVYCDKAVERSVQIYIPSEKKTFSPVF